MRFLVYGHGGWIGGMMASLIETMGHEAIASAARMEDYVSLSQELQRVVPDRVLNCAGITGRPNVDWCEDHKGQTVLVNVCGTLNLAQACEREGIHLTNFASGCIYAGGLEAPFAEDAEPNFEGSTYSLTKVLVDKCIKRCYPRVCQLRLRMPISDALDERSFITKITRYAKVVDMPNSMSVLSDLLPLALDLAVRGRTGTFNLVNPGVISHNQILQLYRDIVDPSFTWENFTVEEQSEILKAPRSNCAISSAKLEGMYQVPPVLEAVTRVLHAIAKK